MQSYQAKAPTEKKEKSSVVTMAVVGGTTFLFGAVIAFGYVQWNSQKQQLALMTQMVEQMGQTAAAPAPVADADTVTRDEPIDLLTMSAAAAPIEAASVAPETVVAPFATADPVVAIAEPAAPVQEVADTPTQSTADKLRALVALSETPVTATATLDEKQIAAARRMETLAIIHAGVEELVAAVVAGQYDIHTNYEDKDFSGRIHFAFVGREDDQKALEKFLANAAETGIVAHSASVVDGDGSVNGHILLFDLVERALENGTLEEQRAGEKMRASAVAMLAKDATVGQVADASVDRYYTVESGDSLAYIALQFYGNINSYELIFQANRSQLRTPDRIRVGQKLLIPSA